MALQLVVFDIAGTTVSDEGGAVNRCLRESLADYGLVVTPQDVDAVMGLAKPEALRILISRHTQADSTLDRVDTIHREFVGRMVAHYASHPSVGEVDGVSALFTELKKSGVMVALDTGFSREITEVILSRTRWRETGLVDTAVSSDEVASGRPSPLMIHELMRRLGVSQARDVAKVGDAPADLEEGTNAGCGWVIGVTWGTHTREHLHPYPHTHLVDSVVELEVLLRSDLDVTASTSSGDRG
jgi:phosphonatase-like hydrolase